MSLRHELAALGELSDAEQRALQGDSEVHALRADNALFHQDHDRRRMLESITRRAHMRAAPPTSRAPIALAALAAVTLAVVTALAWSPSPQGVMARHVPSCDLSRHHPITASGGRARGYVQDMIACMKVGRQEIEGMSPDASSSPPPAFSYACEQGFASACYHIGYFHHHGARGFQGPNGSALSPTSSFELRLLAARFYERGCTLGEGTACCALGNLLEGDAPVRAHTRLESAPWFSRSERLAPERCVRYTSRDQRHTLEP